MEEAKRPALGTHVLAEYFQCPADRLNDPQMLEQELVQAAKMAGASVVGSHFHTYSPVGVSGVVVIKESHFAIHTWPEHGYAAVDFFTCSPHMDYELAYEFLAQVLNAGHHFHKVIPRGEARHLQAPTPISTLPSS